MNAVKQTCKLKGRRVGTGAGVVAETVARFGAGAELLIVGADMWYRDSRVRID